MSPCTDVVSKLLWPHIVGDGKQIQRIAKAESLLCGMLFLRFQNSFVPL